MRRVKASRAEVLEALRGRITAHHRFMLKLHLGHIDALNKAIVEIEKEVGLGLEPFRKAAKLLSTMPGLSEISAHVVVAEIDGPEGMQLALDRQRELHRALHAAPVGGHCHARPAQPDIHGLALQRLRDLIGSLARAL